MYSPNSNEFVPVPMDRPLTSDESKLVKFYEGERVFIKGLSFRVQKIEVHSITLAPIYNPMANSRKKEQ